MTTSAAARSSCGRRRSFPSEGGPRFKVLKAWKGKYEPATFLAHCVNPAGEYICRMGEHGVQVVDGQEIVFFFARPKKGERIGPHSTSFPITRNSVLYASTSDDEELRRTWHVAELEKRVRALSLPMAVSADGRYRLQCMEVERARADLVLRFLVEPVASPWHPTRDLFAEDAIHIEGAGMRHGSVDGTVEVRIKTDAKKLDGLVVECRLLHVPRVKWHALDQVALGKSAPLVAGPYRLHVEAEKKSATVICGIDRRRPVPELDVRWLFAAIHVVDHKFRPLVATSSGGSHRGGAAEFELESKEALVYPLRLGRADSGEGGTPQGAHFEFPKFVVTARATALTRRVRQVYGEPADG